MESKTKRLMEVLRKTPMFRQLVPQEAGIGWPIPLRKQGKVYATLPCFSYAPIEQGKTVLYPPFATITINWSNGLPVEYVNLRFQNPWPEGDWEGQVGTFPHAAVAGLSVGQYQEKRYALLAMYDAMFAMLAQGSPFTPEWTTRFGRLLHTLMEPSLEPYYHALGPKFFDRFLTAASPAQ